MSKSRRIGLGARLAQSREDQEAKEAAIQARIDAAVQAETERCVETDPYSVTCLVCKRGVGQSCTSSREEKRLGEAHTRRWRAAIRAEPDERGEGEPVITHAEVEALLEEGRKLGGKLRKELDRLYDIPPEVLFMRLR